ncbi:MAG: MFS transporter [Pseudomonadaceae bacterium]|nr:MFS transporter [Pseudomonadaceae bacterium]
MTYEEKLSRNLHRTLLLGFFQVFLVIIPVAVPFFQSKGLSMQEVFSLQALFGLVVLLTEVPSGYLADVLGRRNTLVAGAIVAALGHSALLVADGFWTLAIFEVLLGLSHSLISGTDLALLYDTEVAMGRSEDEQRQVVGKLYSARTFSEALAGLACTLVLLFASFDELVYLQVLVGWLPVLLVLRLVEPPGQRLESSGHMANMGRILRYLATHSAVLRLVFLALSIWSLTTFYAVWLLQKLWETQGVELAHFGWLWGGLTLLAAFAGRWAHRFEDLVGSRVLLVFIGLAPAVGYIGLEVFGVVGGLMASATFFLARGFGLVVLRDALNRRVPGEFRATANSLASFGFRGAFVLTGPFVGYSHDIWGMQTTLVMLAVITLVIFGGLILPLVAAIKNGQTQVAPGQEVSNG